MGKDSQRNDRFRERREALKEKGLEEIEGCRIECGDFRKLLPKLVKDSIVDLIFTDPPYKREFLSLWEDLGREAKRVLKDGAYLITYCGHYQLPEVMQALGNHLSFYHPCGVKHTRGTDLMYSKNIQALWKPILIYSKGKGRDHQQIFDFLVGEKGDKEVHPWAQAVSEAEYFIKAFTVEGEFVVDPFCGMGTTIKAGRVSRRKALGIDVDLSCCEVAEGFVKE